MMIMLLGGPLLQPFIGYLLDKLNFTGTTMQFQLALLFFALLMVLHSIQK